MSPPVPHPRGPRPKCSLRHSVLNAAKSECSSELSFSDLRRTSCIFPAAEKERSTPADENGATRYCFAILTPSASIQSFPAAESNVLFGVPFLRALALRWQRLRRRPWLERLRLLALRHGCRFAAAAAAASARSASASHVAADAFAQPHRGHVVPSNWQLTGSYQQKE